MAITTIQITISSNSSNGEYAGRVFKGWETYSINMKGEQITKKRLWTVWVDFALNFTKGDLVEFHGELGTKAAQLDKDGKTYFVVEHTLNHARATLLQKASLPAVTEANAPVASEQSPF